MLLFRSRVPVSYGRFKCNFLGNNETLSKVAVPCMKLKYVLSHLIMAAYGTSVRTKEPIKTHCY